MSKASTCAGESSPSGWGSNLAALVALVTFVSLVALLVVLVVIIVERVLRASAATHLRSSVSHFYGGP